MPSHDVTVNGISLHYQTWGEFTRPERTVLLVHGLTGSSQAWTQLGPTLAAQGWHAIGLQIVKSASCELHRPFAGRADRLFPCRESRKAHPEARAGGCGRICTG